MPCPVFSGRCRPTSSGGLQPLSRLGLHNQQAYAAAAFALSTPRARIDALSDRRLQVLAAGRPIAHLLRSAACNLARNRKPRCVTADLVLCVTFRHHPDVMTSVGVFTPSLRAVPERGSTSGLSVAMEEPLC